MAIYIIHYNVAVSDIDIEDINHYMCLYLSVIILKSDWCSPLISNLPGFGTHFAKKIFAHFPKIFAYKASQDTFTQKYLHKSLPGFGTHLPNKIFSYKTFETHSPKNI